MPAANSAAALCRIPAVRPEPNPTGSTSSISPVSTTSASRRPPFFRRSPSCMYAVNTPSANTNTTFRTHRYPSASGSSPCRKSLR